MEKRAISVAPSGVASDPEIDALIKDFEKRRLQRLQASGRQMELGPVELPPESYGGITDEEMTSMMKHLAPAVALALRRAGIRLNWALCFARNERCWRDLFESFKSREYVETFIDVIEESGNVRSQAAWVDFASTLPTEVAAALSVFEAAMQMAMAPPETLISDSLQTLAEKKSQYKKSLIAVAANKELSVQRSERTRAVAHATISKLSDANLLPIASLVLEVQVKWAVIHPETSVPGYKKILPELRALLPLHPRLNPKK